jgi:hypothetical protein
VLDNLKENNVSPSVVESIQKFIADVEKCVHEFDGHRCIHCKWGPPSRKPRQDKFAVEDDS